MAIEIIPKSKIKNINWLLTVLVGGGVLLLALVISHFILASSCSKITKEIQQKVQAITKTYSEQAQEKELLAIERKINDFNKVLAAHQNTFNIFTFIEERCHPKVWFSKFSFTTAKPYVDVSGRAESFVVLGQQILILKEAELLKNINLSGLSISEDGGVIFTLQLTFDSRVLQ